MSGSLYVFDVFMLLQLIIRFNVVNFLLEIFCVPPQW